jgi:hypothetical protein
MGMFHRAPCAVQPATVQRAPAPFKNVVFRPAEPSDADAVVSLIYSSAPAVFDFLFAVPGVGDPQKFLRRAFADDTGQFGFSNHLVGVEDRVVVAVGAAWCGASRWAFTLAGARQIFACYGWTGAALAVIARAVRIEQVIVPPARGELYI